MSARGAFSCFKPRHGWLLSPLLTRLNPKEILIPSAIDTPLREMLTETGYTLTELAVFQFLIARAETHA